MLFVSKENLIQEQMSHVTFYPLSESGRVFTWGRACYGQLGRPVPANEGAALGGDTAQTESSPMPHSVPIEIPDLAGASQVVKCFTLVLYCLML